MIVILFFTIFAVMGITLFKGYFEYCMISPNESGKLEQLILNDIIDNKYKCINYGGEWQTYYKNFDDLGTAAHIDCHYVSDRWLGRVYVPCYALEWPWSSS